MTVANTLPHTSTLEGSEAEAHKDAGNALFRARKLHQATKRYFQGIESVLEASQGLPLELLKCITNAALLVKCPEIALFYGSAVLAFPHSRDSISILYRVSVACGKLGLIQGGLWPAVVLSREGWQTDDTYLNDNISNLLAVIEKRSPGFLQQCSAQGEGKATSDLTLAGTCHAMFLQRLLETAPPAVQSQYTQSTSNSSYGETRNTQDTLRLKRDADKAFSEGKFRQALYKYTEALRTFRFLPMLQNNLAAIYIKEKDYPLAISCSLAALVFQPNSAKAYERAATAAHGAMFEPGSRLAKVTADLAREGLKHDPDNLGLQTIHAKAIATLS